MIQKGNKIAGLCDTIQTEVRSHLFLQLKSVFLYAFPHLLQAQDQWRIVIYQQSGRFPATDIAHVSHNCGNLSCIWTCNSASIAPTLSAGHAEQTCIVSNIFFYEISQVVSLKTWTEILKTGFASQDIFNLFLIKPINLPVRKQWRQQNESCLLAKHVRCCSHLSKSRNLSTIQLKLLDSSSSVSRTCT